MSTAAGGTDVHTVLIPRDEPPAEVDVLIVGAGPVGLAAAVELERRGVTVAVVDVVRHKELVRAGAMGHSARTVEHFRRWGLLQEIREEWTFPPEWNRGLRLVTSLAGHELVPGHRPAFTDRGGSRFSHGEALRRPQTVLQQVFLRRLSARGVRVSGGWRLEALAQDKNAVVASLTEVDSGEKRQITASYLIGADGASSTVRTLSGIDRDGERATRKRLRLVVRHGDISAQLGPAPSANNIVFNDRASGFLAAISPTEWRVYAGPYPLDHEPEEKELLEIARAAFGLDIDLELVSATTFYNSTRIAQNFRSGRVLLAGDAAHVRTPGGNLGEGIGDVVNLGWKLTQVLTGHAPEALLDSYDAERRPHNHRIGDEALARANAGAEALARFRADGIPADDDPSEWAQRRRREIAEELLARRVEGPGLIFDERYDASPVIWYDDDQDEAAWDPAVYEDDPKPGHRAPDGAIDPFGTTLYDRLGDDFGLVVTGGERSVERAFLEQAAERGLRLQVVHLSDPAAVEIYGTTHTLVRPDQHVAWRGTELPEGGAGAVLDVVLGASRVRELAGAAR